MTRVKRAPSPAALTLAPPSRNTVGRIGTQLGELSGEERSDEAGQFVGKRAGSAAAVAQ